MKYPPTFCQQIYNYEFDKPDNYQISVSIPKGIYFLDKQKKKNESAKRRMKNLKDLQ